MKGNLGSILLALINPLLGMICGTKFFMSKIGMVIFLIFCCHINYCQVIRPEDDLTSYVGNYNYWNDGFSYMVLYVNLLVEKDFYFPLSMFAFSYFHLPCIYIYTFWTLVFSIGLYYIYRYLIPLCSKAEPLSIYILICAFFAISLIDFQGVRNMTAFIYFVLVAYNLANKENKKFADYVLLIVPPCIHFSLIISCILYLALVESKLSLKILLLLSYASLVFHFLPADLLSRFIDFGRIFGDVYTQYADGSRNQEIAATGHLGVYLYAPLAFTFMYLMWRIVKRNHHNTLSDKEKNLLRLGLFAIIVFNCGALSIDFFSRFKRPYILLTAYPILYFMYKNKTIYSTLLKPLLVIGFIGFNFDGIMQFPETFDCLKMCFGTIPTDLYLMNDKLEGIGAFLDRFAQ